MMLFRLIAFFVLATSPLRAEGLRIVTDIAPVQSLVQKLAGPGNSVDVLLPPGASPHSHALRPSQARALQEADLVVWIGPSLTPWMEDAVGGLAAQSRLVTLADVEGIVRYPFRQVALFGGGDSKHKEHDHDHDHDHAGHADDDHAAHDHAAHDHAGHDHTGHDSVGHDHAKDDDHAGHDHDHAGGLDPHLWLDPRNAMVWLDDLSGILQELAPEQATNITARKEAAQASLQALEGDIAARLDSVRNAPFLVYHDAYQYFETRFSLSSAGALAASDALAPGPARLSELKAALAEQQISCVFYEPQYSPRLLAALEVDGTIRQAELDPLGSDLLAGPDHYDALLRNLADTMAECLSASD